MLMMKGRTGVTGIGLLRWIVGLLACAGAFASDVALAQATLDSVKKRTLLHCGISPVAPGFSELDDRGSRRGFDVDICRAVAAAVLGDASRVEFAPLDVTVRFQAVQSRQVDLLSAQTTWTFSRDASVGLDFGPVVFYDGQAIMVAANLGVRQPMELSGSAICLLPGTTSLQNIEDYFRPRGIAYEPVVFENSDEWRNAFLSGRCDAISADRSVIVSVRSMASDPDRYIILPDTISNEPLAPAMRQNDSQWRDVVSWTIYALITAERLGIGQANLDSFNDSRDPEIQRLLGRIGDFGKMLSLDNKWAYNAIKAVGNYGEIFDRNLGPSTALKLDRGTNKLWTEGGLIFSPPFR
jgi:general L-amino acid transport system substrate-binding protein